MKKFAVFDIDGTLFRWQLFHAIVFDLVKNGHITAKMGKKIDKSYADWQNRTHSTAFKDYELTVVEAFLSCLKGLKVRDIEIVADRVLADGGKRVYTYSRDLIKQLRNQGYTLIAVSGSQDEVVQRFARLWDFDIAVGQTHDSKDGVYTGTISGQLLVTKKDTILKQIVKRHDLSWKDSLAIGDSLSDAAILKLVDQPLAFNPDKLLYDMARENHWNIVIERKNVIYQLRPHGNSYLLA